MSQLMLDVDQAGELKAAFRRGNWTNGQIKTLCEGDVLARVLLVLEEKAEIIIKSILSFIMTITISAIAGKKTSECLKNEKRYSYRDPDLDAWLPEDQLEQPNNAFSVQELAQPATFKQAAESFLGITGEVLVIAQALKDRHCITTLMKIESLIDRQEAGEDVGFRVDGYANFFFVEDKDGSVSVVSVYRYDGRWFVSVRRLVSSVEWFAGGRFFFATKIL